MSGKTSIKIIFSTAIVFLSAVFSQAQDVAKATEKTISPEKKALIKEYVAATGGREAIEKNLDAMYANLNNVMPSIIEANINNDAALTAAQKAEILKDMPAMVARINQKLKDDLNRELNYAQVIEDINYPLLDKFFTEAELKDLVAFYKSPTGQKAISLQPEIYTEAATKLNAILLPALQKVMKNVTDAEISERAKKVKPVN